MVLVVGLFFFSSRRRHTICALVTGVQTCALPISFFDTSWEVHFNSSRTGVRLIGPKPEWARADGGEAGLHPSNIHDNPYAIGAVDFTGDMPVIQIGRASCRERVCQYV